MKRPKDKTKYYIVANWPCKIVPLPDGGLEFYEYDKVTQMFVCNMQSKRLVSILEYEDHVKVLSKEEFMKLLEKIKEVSH